MSDAELRTAITAMYRMSLRSNRTNDVKKAVDTKLQSVIIPVISSLPDLSQCHMVNRQNLTPHSQARTKRGGGAAGLQPTPESNVDTLVSNAIRDLPFGDMK